jgi:hypothetical protein
MSANHNISRVVRSWIREEEHDSADHILQIVLSRLDSTPQRRSWWPAWRSLKMNRLATIAAGAVAVLVLAVVAYQFLPTTSVGPPASSPTSSPRPRSAFPPEGPLAEGTHPAVLDGIPLSFSVRGSGWTVPPGYSIQTGEYGQPDYVGIDFWPSAPDNVYADPCAHTPLSPPPGTSAASLAAAVATVPVVDVVSGPASVEVGGHPAQYLVLTINEDIDCEPHDAWLWYDESTGGATGGWRWAEGLGARYRIWIIDVDGTLVWIDAYTFPDADAGLGRDIQEIIGSIEFE